MCDHPLKCTFVGTDPVLRDRIKIITIAGECAGSQGRKKLCLNKNEKFVKEEKI